MSRQQPFSRRCARRKRSGRRSWPGPSCLTSSARPLCEEDEDEISHYWSRFRRLDYDLNSIFLMLPETLRLPAAFSCQHAVFVNVLAHVAIICLHQPEMRRVRAESDHSHHPETSAPATDPSLAPTTLRQSRDRMLTAAQEIQHIFSISQNLEMALRNMMQDFAAYTAALVFLERLTADHGDAACRSSVAFLLDVLNIAGQANPSAKVFAARLAADLDRFSVSVTSHASG